jgi:hypothetical protein
MDAINISLPNSFRISASMFAVLLLTGSLSLTGCAGAYFVGGATCFGLAPAPVVFSVVPSPLEMNALPVTMEVTGDNFQTWSTVYWDKVPLQTRYVNSSHLEVALKTMPVSNSDGTAQISVFTAHQAKNHTVGCTDGGFSGTVVIFFH